MLVKLQLLNYNSDIIVAMGNSKGIVKRLKIETIDAAKYLIIMRYEFND